MAGTGKRKANEVDTKPRPLKKMPPVSAEVIDLDGDDLGAAHPSSPKVAGSSMSSVSAVISRNSKTPARVTVIFFLLKICFILHYYFSSQHPSPDPCLLPWLQVKHHPSPDPRLLPWLKLQVI